MALLFDLIMNPPSVGGGQVKVGVWLLGNLTSSYTSTARDSTCAAPEVVRRLLALLADHAGKASDC